MHSVVRTRILLFLLSLIVVPIATYSVILFARGYRPDISQKTLSPTGLLVATSSPDGAQILVDGKVTSATNTTLNLSPGTYEVEIKKDSFQPWKKTLVLKAEMVPRAAAVLFPNVPSLKAITTSGAAFPILAPDGSKVAFLQSLPQGSKIYTVELSESPLGLINREPKSLTTLSAIRKVGRLTWSPDSRYILATATSSAFLVDTSNLQSTDASLQLPVLLKTWQTQKESQDKPRLEALPQKLQDILTPSAANLAWAPSEKKLLYIATDSAVIPDDLKKPLPGSSTQTQERSLTPGQVYVYDTEEDRNFRLTGTGWQWFPDSAHLIKAEKGQIIVMEYDAQNPTVVYAGPMETDFVDPYPSGRGVLILSNLNPSLSSVPNLYAVSLK